MIIALLFNIERKKLLENNPIDILASFDSKETVDTIKKAIEENGHEVILIEANEHAYRKLRKNKNKIDLVFNLAEWMNGDFRVCFLPSICELLGIPYTGSSPATLSVCYDKARAKEILLYNGIPTPKFQFFKNKKEKLNPDMKFPLIVKLNAEGSKMGMSKDSIVKNEKELKKQLSYLFKVYNEEVIAEEFLTGREFTVGVLGDKEPIVLPPLEIKYPNNLKAEERFLTYEAESGKDYHEICPALVSKKLELELKETALKAYKALNCRDWGRVDIRLDENGKIYVLELNPNAGIAPDFWFPLAAKEVGFEYTHLIGKIINFAVDRYKQKLEILSK